MELIGPSKPAANVCGILLKCEHYPVHGRADMYAVRRLLCNPRLGSAACMRYFVGMNSILYLDFDGVLHPEGVHFNHEGRIYLSEEYCSQGHRLFESTSYLIDALRPYPEIKVVLSTTWARVFSFERAAQFLPDELSRRVIGGTFDPTTSGAAFDALSRGDQVVADVSRRGCQKWIALDDDADNWPREHLTKLLRTRPALGLQDLYTRGLLEQRVSTLL